MRGTLLFTLLSLFVLMASAVSAASLAVDGGFEDPALSDGDMVPGPGILGNAWMLNTGTVAIINPAGNGSASEGLAVEEGSNYLKMWDDPWGDENATSAWFFVENTTIQANHRYTYRFRYGKSSDPTKTWTEMGVWMAANTELGVWENRPFGNPYLVTWSGDPGWRTWEYSETVRAGDPKVGKYLAVTLEGKTRNATDVYYFDKVEIIDTPLLPMSITYQGELKNALGAAVADTPRDFVFKFYGEETGGLPNWTSSTMSITPSGGFFTAQINNIETKTAFPNGNVWLEVGVGGETLLPRTKVHLEPFSLVGGGIQ